MVFYQNCSNPSAENPSVGGETQSSFSPGVSLEGNGAGYTGKLEIAAPVFVDLEQPFVVTVTGGTRPYRFSIESGTVNAVDQGNGNFEITVVSTTAVDQFEIFVEDVNQDRASALIEIVENDDVYNYSFAGAGAFTNDRKVIFDQQLRLVLVFEKSGKHLRTLAPGGKRSSHFSANVDLAFDSNDRLIVLDSGQAKIHMYDRNFNFMATHDIDQSTAGTPSSLVVHGEQVYLVNSQTNKIFSLSTNNLLSKPDLFFDDTSNLFQSLSSMALSSDGNTLYLADSMAKDIKVFVDGAFSHRLAHFVEGGSSVDFQGPRRLIAVGESQLLVQDSIFKTGRYAGVTSGYMGEEKTILFNHSTLQGKTIHSRYTSDYHAPTDCLSSRENLITYCNLDRVFMVADLSGETVEGTWPSLGPINSVAEPWYLAVADDGSYFVSSVWHLVVGLSSKNEVLYRSGGFGAESPQNFGISGLAVAGDRLYVSSNKSNKIQVFAKSTYQHQFDIDLTGPRLISIADDSVFVSSSEDNLLILGLDGKVLQSIPHFFNPMTQQTFDLKRAQGLHAVSLDKIYLVGDLGKKLFQVDSNGNVLKEFDVPGFSQGIAVDSLGRVYLAQETSILVLHAETGEILQRFGLGGTEPGTFNGARSIAIKGSYLFVSDHFNQRVQKISLSLFKSP